MVNWDPPTPAGWRQVPEDHDPIRQKTEYEYVPTEYVPVPVRDFLLLYHCVFINNVTKKYISRPCFTSSYQDEEKNTVPLDLFFFFFFHSTIMSGANILGSEYSVEFPACSWWTSYM